MDPSIYYSSWWPNHNSCHNWYMDPNKTGGSNPPPPAHNMSGPPQHPQPSPHGLQMGQPMPPRPPQPGYAMPPRPAHTGSTVPPGPPKTQSLSPKPPQAVVSDKSGVMSGAKSVPMSNATSNPMLNNKPLGLSPAIFHQHQQQQQQQQQHRQQQHMQPQHQGLSAQQQAQINASQHHMQMGQHQAHPQQQQVHHQVQQPPQAVPMPVSVPLPPHTTSNPFKGPAVTPSPHVTAAKPTESKATPPPVPGLISISQGATPSTEAPQALLTSSAAYKSSVLGEPKVPTPVSSAKAFPANVGAAAAPTRPSVNAHAAVSSPATAAKASPNVSIMPANKTTTVAPIKSTDAANTVTITPTPKPASTTDGEESNKPAVDAGTKTAADALNQNGVTALKPLPKPSVMAAQTTIATSLKPDQASVETKTLQATPTPIVASVTTPASPKPSVPKPNTNVPIMQRHQVSPQKPPIISPKTNNEPVLNVPKAQAALHNSAVSRQSASIIPKQSITAKPPQSSPTQAAMAVSTPSPTKQLLVPVTPKQQTSPGAGSPKAPPTAVAGPPKQPKVAASPVKPVTPATSPAPAVTPAASAAPSTPKTSAAAVVAPKTLAAPVVASKTSAATVVAPKASAATVVALKASVAPAKADAPIKPDTPAEPKVELKETKVEKRTDRSLAAKPEQEKKVTPLPATSPTKVEEKEEVKAPEVAIPKQERRGRPPASKAAAANAKTDSTAKQRVPRGAARKAAVAAEVKRCAEEDEEMADEDEKDEDYNQDEDDEEDAERHAKKRASRSKRKVSETPSEGERRSKRSRQPASVYQSPLVDSVPRIPRSLITTPKTPQEKLVLFFKNEHVALRNAEGTFYLCQIAQNVYKSTPKIKIRWLSPTDESNKDCDTFKPDYYDITDFDCILTSVDLERCERRSSMMRLPENERKRIHNILQRALDRDKGVTQEKDELNEDHPDGLDLSLYNDEAQLKTKKRKRKKEGKEDEDESESDEDDDDDEQEDEESEEEGEKEEEEGEKEEEEGEKEEEEGEKEEESEEEKEEEEKEEKEEEEKVKEPPAKIPRRRGRPTPARRGRKPATPVSETAPLPAPTTPAATPSDSTPMIARRGRGTFGSSRSVARGARSALANKNKTPAAPAASTPDKTEADFPAPETAPKSTGRGTRGTAKPAAATPSEATKETSTPKSTRRLRK